MYAGDPTKVFRRSSLAYPSGAAQLKCRSSFAATPRSLSFTVPSRPTKMLLACKAKEGHLQQCISMTSVIHAQGSAAELGNSGHSPLHVLVDCCCEAYAIWVEATGTIDLAAQQ